MLPHFSSQQPYKKQCCPFFTEEETETLGDQTDLLRAMEWQNSAFICSLTVFIMKTHHII